MGNASLVWEVSLDCPSHFYLKEVGKIILNKSPPTYQRVPPPPSCGEEQLMGYRENIRETEQPRQRNMLGLSHGDNNHGEGCRGTQVLKIQGQHIGSACTRGAPSLGSCLCGKEECATSRQLRSMGASTSTFLFRNPSSAKTHRVHGSRLS